jgi:hypothetical protein
MRIRDLHPPPESWTTSRARQAAYSGTGTSTDIVVASARAYVAAINRMLGQQLAAAKGAK